MKKLIEILKSLFGEDLKDEEIAKANGIKEDALEARTEHLETISEFFDDFPPDAQPAILEISKEYAFPEVIEKEIEKEIDFIAELMDVEKAGARLSKATLAQLQKIYETLGAMLKAGKEKLGKSTDDDKVSAETLELREQIKTYKDAETERAKEEKATMKKNLDEANARAEKAEKDLKKALDPAQRNSIISQDDDVDPDVDGNVKKKIAKSADGQEVYVWGSLVSPDSR